MPGRRRRSRSPHAAPFPGTGPGDSDGRATAGVQRLYDQLDAMARQRAEDVNMRLAEKTPSETDFEEVAVVVYFPKIGASYEGEEDTLLIKARLSTLAIRGYTPQEAQQESSTRGSSAAAAGLPGGAGAAPGGAGGAGAGRSGNSGSSNPTAGTGK